ncbi:hypothetical protein [Halomicronema sp. CCY15110]|uniref:hypothetical protein n=1 Tax=Halomicronema sp. CCY15110 TaxID=2767773 RepID=UPI001951CBD3|nr:hypothetical protein [Halomicronema sp. CCY15110]
MNNPVLWLCLSFLLLSVSLTAVFVVLVPAVVEMSRAARSFERLCNTLDRDLPPTLESLRQTTDEIARLTDDVNAGVKNAGRVAQQVDQSVTTARMQAKHAQINTRSLMAGLGAAWTTFNQSGAQKSDSRGRSRPAQMSNPETLSTTQAGSPPPVADGDRSADPTVPPASSSTGAAQDTHAINEKAVSERDRAAAHSADGSPTDHDAASTANDS